MYEDKYAFAIDLRQFLWQAPEGGDVSPEALHLWHLIEARYPTLLADWLTQYNHFEAPHEQGVRIGKKPEHLKGGWRNVPDNGQPLADDDDDFSV